MRIFNREQIANLGLIQEGEGVVVTPRENIKLTAAEVKSNGETDYNKLALLLHNKLKASPQGMEQREAMDYLKTEGFDFDETNIALTILYKQGKVSYIA